ncbi:MAG: Crp/Fnr family transcriptional regulator [Gelidibacter sp.]
MTANDLHYEYCLNKLRINPLFENLDDETMESLMGCLSLKKWNKNSEFFYGDQTFYKFFIIISGRLKMYQIDIENGREFTVFLLTQNDVFDVVSLLDGLKHSMNFETIDDVEVLYAPIDLMRDWIESHPKINKTLLPYLGRCMRMLEVNLTDNVLSDIPTRLAKLILSNVNESSHQLQLINDLSNDEIANMIGSTRAVVNRQIQIFKKAGMLDIHRKSISIKDLKLLLDEVSGKY